MGRTGAQRFELGPHDADYPRQLSGGVRGRWPRIFGVGDRSVLATDALAVVGSRRPTPYGLAAAELAGRVAAECGVTVVTGGSLGCDQAAARSALDAGGTTIIVCAQSPDHVYPPSSADVFADTVERGGAVVSAECWGTPVRPQAFLGRNELIAALARAVVVCEAALRSGTTRTATVAAELGREVYAVPGSIFSTTSVGTNRLVADGACPVISEVDLEQRIALDFGVSRRCEAGLPTYQGALVSALAATPMRPDDLACRLSLSVLTLLQILTDLEATGVVCRLPDGRFALTSESYLSLRHRGAHARASTCLAG